MTLLNTLVAMPLLYLVYDFFYTLFHWALHIKAIYAYIHKHHHMQKAPSRGNTDAINVHPFEYICGEFNHLFALYLVSTHMCEVHVATSMVFLAVGGYLAGLNHTRDDIVWLAYDSKAHDVHHRIPQSNYGQYCMVWDRLFGTFRPYNPKDRVNPKAQLNPATGKSYEYEEAKKMT
jgi:sterol desaturase/sphingolipid hydroxylase (fatty acid hydroxylase superfamily)